MHPSIHRAASRAASALLLLLSLLTTAAAYGQAGSLPALKGSFARYQQAALAEKLFLHLDRPTYVSGELLWFKVYAVDGTTNKPLDLSTVAYVEILDQQNHPVAQTKVELKDAAGQGSFALPSGLTSGTYTVRAYTSWMKNFPPDTYFHRAITIVNTFAASGAVARKDSATVDVQFFPEGGQLVQGLPGRLAFKVTSKAGKGVAATGQVLDQQGRAVASFRTLRFGMGSFTFTPEAGRTYSAVLTLDKSRVVRRPLPAAADQGYVLRLDEAGADQLTLTVTAPANAPTETLYLLGHSRQHVAVAAQATLTGGRAVFTVGKGQLLEGVSHFTVFSADQKPRCERLYFRRPARQLTLTAAGAQPQYAARDKVSVQVATAASAQPTAADLSMAVYRLDSLTTAPVADIASYLWLAADLKGTIESPDYYFSATGPEAAEAADNLMLTQGWSRFHWDQALAATPPVFANQPELYGPIIKARLTRPGTGQPISGLITFLSSPSRIVHLNTARSNSDGLVQFEMHDFYGPRDIVVQTHPQQDTTARIEVLSPFSEQYAALPGLGFAASPRLRPDFARRHFQSQVQSVYAGRYRNRYAAMPLDSTPFYGVADETYLLDSYTRFKVLEEVLREYVTGVQMKVRKDGLHLAVTDKVNRQVLAADPMMLLDGVPVFSSRKMLAMDPLKIRKLDVMDSRYLQGPVTYDGLVSFSTYKGDLEGFHLDPRVLVQQYEGMQQQREFYAPRYDTPEQQQSRLPDLRNLLYWNPDLRTAPGAATPVSFFTGDQAGRYLVVVQGLSAAGLAGSTTFTFEVKPAL